MWIPSPSAAAIATLVRGSRDTDDVSAKKKRMSAGVRSRSYAHVVVRQRREDIVKGFGVCIVVMTLAPLARAIPIASLAPHAAAQVEAAGPLPGSFQSDDLSAWSLEKNYGLLIIPRSLPTRSRSTPGFSSRLSSHQPSVGGRNGNPLNIKFGSETRRHVAIGLATISEIVPLDGGRFLKFDSPEAGFRAAVALLTTPAYRDLKVDQALRKWSNNGYGAEILLGTPLDARKLVSDLGPDDLKVLLAAMAAAEGYRSSTIKSEIEKAFGL